MRAKVIFTDGFHVSPTIETDSEDLKERIKKILGKYDSPAMACGMFTVQTMVKKLPATLHNTPEGRSFGVTVSSMMHEGFWPGNHADQAGVFLCWVDAKKIEYWGGLGFDDSQPFTAGIMQTEEL